MRSLTKSRFDSARARLLRRVKGAVLLVSFKTILLPLKKGSRVCFNCWSSGYPSFASLSRYLVIDQLITLSWLASASKRQRWGYF